MLRTRKWAEDENGKRKRGKDGFRPSDYDKCCKNDWFNWFHSVQILSKFYLRLDHDIWSKGHPQPADFKLGSVYDYYDIFEYIGIGYLVVVQIYFDKINLK